MNLLFASMHGSGSMEIALLCRHTGVQLCFPLHGNGMIDTLVKEEDGDYLEPLGAKLMCDQEMRDESFDAIMISKPNQITQAREGMPGVPIIVRHGLNSFDKFKKLGVKNFLSPSRRALDIMSECHGFLMRKLIDWDNFPASDTYADERHTIDSYIHDYDKKWPIGKEKFDKVASELDGLVKVRWHGRGSAGGMVDDISTMKHSRATLHLKEGQVVCNAVIRSMAVGTPVIMDEETHEECFFDNIKGLLIGHDISDLVRMILELSDPDLLDEKCDNFFRLAKDQFTYDDDFGTRFVNYLANLRIK